MKNRASPHFTTFLLIHYILINNFSSKKKREFPSQNCSDVQPFSTNITIARILNVMQLPSVWVLCNTNCSSSSTAFSFFFGFCSHTWWQNRWYNWLCTFIFSNLWRFRNIFSFEDLESSLNQLASKSLINFTWGIVI